MLRGPLDRFDWLIHKAAALPNESVAAAAESAKLKSARHLDDFFPIWGQKAVFFDSQAAVVLNSKMVRSADDDAIVKTELLFPAAADAHRLAPKTSDRQFPAARILDCVQSAASSQADCTETQWLPTDH